MKKFLLTLSLMFACVSLFAVPQLPDDGWERAYQAWDNGDYLAALRGFENLLRGPESSRWLDRIALVTGELYPDIELTPDGRSPRFSPSGRYLAYESGVRPATVTHILSADRAPARIAEINGEGLVFSPTRDVVAFLRPKDTPAIIALRKEIGDFSRAAVQDRQALMARQRQLSALESRNMDLFTRELVSGNEQRLDDDGLFKAGMAFSADGKEIYFAGTRDIENAACEIYGLPEGGKPRALTSGPGFKTSPITIPGGTYLVYTLAQQSPFGMPATGDQTGRGGQGAPPAGAAGRGGAGGRGAEPVGATGSRGGTGFGGRRVEFAVMNLTGGKPLSFVAAAAPAVSADGSTLVFQSTSGTENSLQVLKLKEPLAPAVVRRSQDRIGSVALSADGSRVTFEMPWNRDKDTEIFCIGSDGTGEVRVTREIQPDWAPRFLSGNRILAIKGERRHARSYVYDLDSSQNFRLFHNNTIRTIAPEYEWTANRAGSMILIVAERDGDTVSAQRGVYLIDLGRKITKDELLARLQADLAVEQGLRTAGEAMFKPIAGKVRGVVDQVSMTKLYEYQDALFKLGIKAIGQPGNKAAGDYIYNTFASFGYKPEYQWFDARGSIRTANVLATLPGTENPELIYVLGSHYDSVAAGPGADDNATGIAVLLETARILAGSPMPATIVFAAFTGEEAGDLGSHEYVRQAKDKLRLMGALNNDMIGWTNDHHLDNTIRYTNDGMRDLQHAAAFLFSRLVTYDARYYKATDAAAFYDAHGDIVSGLGSYPVLGNPYYHQATDLLETVNQQLVCESAKMTAASIMLLAATPARVKDLKVKGSQGGAIELSWAASPEKGVIGYTVAYGTANDPMGRSMSVKSPAAKITGLKMGEPVIFSVKAVNSKGLSSWDWARTTARP